MQERTRRRVPAPSGGGLHKDTWAQLGIKTAMDACVGEKFSPTTEESGSLSAALNQVLLCPHHCRLNNANVAWALDSLKDKFQVTTTAQFVALDLDSASAHLLRNWPVQQFLRCLQSELVATQGGSDRVRLAAVETSVDSFLQVVPQLRQNPAMRACVATRLIECQIDTYDTLRSVPLTDLVAILGHCDDGGKVASSIIDEIRDMEDFSMARLTNAYNAVELWTAGMPLTIDIAVAKMTKLHQLADTLERHIRHTACPLFRGSTDELTALLAATKDYLSKLRLASQHLSATTAEPSLRQPDTELLRITAEDSRFQVNENLLLNTLRLDPEQGSRVVAFVGPTHSGKSTLICHMCPHMPQRPRVARTGVFQPTTNNVHLYDDVMDASNDAAPRETPVPRTLILDVEGIDASPNIPEPGGASADVELERLLQVSQLPRLCYTIANVIVYVDEANFARTSPFKYIIDFAQQSTAGVVSSFPPSLLIVCNKSTVADMELSVEDTTHSYLETHDKDKMLCQAFLRVLCVYVPDKGTEKNYFLFLQRTNLLKTHLETLLQEQQQARRQHNSNLSRAQWGDKFRWIAHHFHDEQLKVTPYEVSLRIGPQFQLEAATLGFFRTVYDDAPNANRWHNYRMACKASITLLAMLTVAANNDSLLSRTLACPLPSQSGESQVQGCENAQKATFVDEKLYRRLVRFIWQHLREIGPCQATRPHCVDGQGKPIHCTQVRNGHHSHRGQSDIWMPESSPLPLFGRVMWAKARKQFGKLFYRQLARPFNVWDGSFAASTEEAELEIELADVFLQEHAAYSKLQDRPLAFFARHIAFLQRSVQATRSGSPSSTICFICQTNPCRGRLLMCGHPFCQFCIEKLSSMQASCPVCAQPVNASVEFQFLSSNESYLSIDPRDFVDQFRRDPNMAKSVTVISVIGRHVPQQASDLSKIRPRVSPQMLKHPLARLFFLLEQNGAQFLSKGPTNLSAIYFSDGFVLVHYNVDYDDRKLWANNATALPHPLYFARCTSDVVVLLKSHDKAEGNLLCQLWRGRYKEILLPPRQSGVCWAVLLASMYKDWLLTSRDGSNPAVALPVPIGFRAGSIHLLRPSDDTDYQGEAHRATLRLVSLIHKAGFFTCQRAHLTEQVVLLTTLWRYVVAQSFIHHLQELCDVWEVEPEIMAPILEPLLARCRQHVHRALIASPAQAQADATPGALRGRVAGGMPAAPTRTCSAEFALWCINVLEAQPEDISFSHLLRWIRVEFAKDRAATNLELFPVHARLASLYDLRESIGAAYVERLYSACQLPTTEPALGFCVLCLDWARGEGVCAPSCGHLICGRCCHGLADLAQHLAEQRRREGGGPPRRGFSGECLFRCPICLEWDVARIHHYIAACRWRDDGDKTALLAGFFAEITRTSYSVLHRSIDEQEVVMPSDEPADVCGVRVGQWRGQAVAIKSYDLVGCQQADFQREMTALVLASGCKHILPVLGACPLFQVVWPLHTNTLEHVLWSTSAPSLINALGLLKDVAKAICCLHALGFLHKNVNPGAIVIQERSHAGRPKAQLWCTERIGGEDQLRIYAASSYRAPECVGPGGGNPTQASDVYGLGKTIKKTLVKVLYNARMALDNWEQIDLLPEACTHDLAQLVDSCLNVDSAKRPSVGDCVKVLSHAIRSQRDMCRSGGSKERLGVAEMDNLQPIAHDLQLPLPATIEKYLLADPDWRSRVANIQRMLTNKSGPFADIVGAFRLAFAERYSSRLSCPSTVLAAVSEVKALATVMVNHLLPLVADSDDGSSFFALKEAVAGEGIYVSLHDMVFERIESNHKHKDELISQKMASWQHLTLAALGAPVEWCLRTAQPYSRQIEDLQHLPRLASPYRKAALLRQVFGDAIAEAQRSHQGRKPLATGYDDTVAVIQYLMLKAQIPRLYSEYYYMDVLLDEATNEELELRSLLGKMGGFIEMVLEDSLEVPIGSVKDALLEATAQREAPKDTALLADIFAFIAQALEQTPLDNAMLPIPIPIKERIEQAALAEYWNESHPSEDGPQWLDRLLLLAGVRLHREQFYLATRYSPVLYHELKWLLHEMHDHQKDTHLHQLSLG